MHQLVTELHENMGPLYCICEPLLPAECKLLDLVFFSKCENMLQLIVTQLLRLLADLRIAKAVLFFII